MDSGKVINSSVSWTRASYLLIGLQSTLSPPKRNNELSDIAVRVCHERPTGSAETGALGKGYKLCWCLLLLY